MTKKTKNQENVEELVQSDDKEEVVEESTDTTEEAKLEKPNKKKEKVGYTTCSVCGTKISKEEAIAISGKKYCQGCSVPILKESEAYKKLMDYIYNLCNKNPYVMKMAARQIKNLKGYGEGLYKYSGMLATLIYAYEYRKPLAVFDPQWGVESVIVKNYAMAKDFNIHLLELRKQTPEKIDNILQAKEREVYIDKESLEYRNKLLQQQARDRIYGPTIDINNIEDDGRWEL